MVSSARLAITSRHTLIRDLHVAFRIPYLHDFIAKLCKQQTEVIQNHEKESFRNMLQKKYSLRGLNFAAVTLTLLARGAAYNASLLFKPFH